MKHTQRNGFALVTALTMMAVLAVLATSYFILTNSNLQIRRSSADAIRGFYAAEGGLNMRATQIRDRFVGYGRPQGTAPSNACLTGSTGTGDFACVSYTLAGRTVQTYVIPQSVAGVSSTIPANEPFGGLNAIQYTYDVYSAARDAANNTEAITQMRFQSRLVPLFQFAAFYNDDLEILPGPNMNLTGRVHSNGNLYVNANNGSTLTFQAQITAGGNLQRGRKNNSQCTGTVHVHDSPSTTRAINCVGGSTTLYPSTSFGPWNGRIRTQVPRLVIPEPSSLNPASGNTFWDEADVRAMWDPAHKTINFKRADGTVILTLSNVDTPGHFNSTGLGSSSGSFLNRRENKTIDMLEVDQQKLMNYIHANRDALLGPGRNLDDSTGGGLVFYFGVDSAAAGNACSTANPGACLINNYGVRIRNAERLGATTPSAPAIRGLTIVTNQAAYVMGHYNRTDKKPAAILADSVNVLSEGWRARAWPSTGPNAETSNGVRTASNGPAGENTTINAAFLGGTDVTTSGSGYNGGLENYPRFHEDWSGRTLTYRGSFVSLGTPKHVNGPWSNQKYQPPVRAWSYDASFNDAMNLPPLTPRFVYLKQELFARQFQQ